MKGEKEMEHCKRLCTLGALGLGVLLAPHAAAEVSCATVAREVVQDTGTRWLRVIGSRMTARGDFGFSAFTMADGFQIETTPLHTAAAAGYKAFRANRYGSSAFTGYFMQVFPGRGNGDEERWSFWLNEDGEFYLRPLSWEGEWVLLDNTVCHRGPEEQFVVTAINSFPGFGTNYWTFVIDPE